MTAASAREFTSRRQTMSRDPRTLAWPDLVWSHFSRSFHDPFDARVAAAARAGFDAIGMYVFEYRRMRDKDGRTVGELGDVLAEHDMELAELEAMQGWWAPEGRWFDNCRTAEELAFELADALGARYLQAIGPYEGSIEDAARGFAELCERASEHDLLVGIEFLPHTNIATARDAQRIVEAADRPNGGYCVDIWHHVRGANDIELIRALGADRIFAVQMSDGPIAAANPDYLADCMEARVAPGDGEFDCVGFTAALVSMGVRAPISLEVCSSELWAAPAGEVAQRAADGMRQILRALPVEGQDRDDG
jgi:sugar phosphate isomerase/epimerase